MPKRRRFRHPYNSARTDHGMLPQLVGLGALSEYLFEGKEVREMSAKKETKPGVDATELYLTRAQVEKAVATYLRQKMFRPEFTIELLSIVPVENGFRVSFCDPALLKADEPPVVD